MTKIEFESKRMDAIIKYGMDANKEMESGKLGKNNYANAYRRFCLAQRLLKLWSIAGFWTEENETAFNMIYTNVPSNSTVSAF